MNQAERQAMIDYLNEQRRHLLAQAVAAERLIELLKNSSDVCYNRSTDKKMPERMTVR